MSYKIRSARRVAKKGRRKFFITIAFIAFIMFATLNWILPTFIGGVGFVKETINPSKKEESPLEENSMLSAPVLKIPYEATNSSEVEIKGFATPNSEVKLFIDDAEVKSVRTEDDGSFTFQNIPLNLGINNIYAKSIDEKGKESLPSKTFKITYDNDKPILTVNEPEDNKKIQGGDKKVKISGNTEAGVKLLINDSQVIVDKDGNFSTEISINEGDNTITIKSVDLAENTTEIQRKITYSP